MSRDVIAPAGPAAGPLAADEPLVLPRSSNRAIDDTEGFPLKTLTR